MDRGPRGLLIFVDEFVICGESGGGGREPKEVEV